MKFCGIKPTDDKVLFLPDHTIYESLVPIAMRIWPTVERWGSLIWRQYCLKWLPRLNAINRSFLPMKKFLRISSFLGLLALAGCATTVDAQAPVQAEPVLEFKIRPPLEANPRADLLYKVLTAELAGKRDQLDVALAHYRQAAALTDDPKIVERAAMLALLVKDNPAALELAQRWQTVAPANDQARQAMALALLRNGRVEEATEYLETVRRLAAAKDKQEGYATLASLLTQVDDKQGALRVMGRFRDRNARSAFAQYYFGLLAAASSERDQALAAINLALARDPKMAPAHQLRVRLLVDQGKDEAALAGLSQAVAALPNDRNLRMSYARLLVEANQLEKARRQFATLVSQNPKDTESLYALGLLAAEVRQFDLAESYFLDLVKRKVRLADAYYELGRIDEQRGAYAKAREWYGRIKSEERYLNAQMRMGVVMAKTETIPTVTQHFDGLRRDNPQNGISLYLAESEALREANHHQASFDTLDRALTVHPDDKDLRYARALAAERLDRLDVLEQDLRAILAADPKNGQALNALGYTLADRTDRHQEALGYIEQALAILPEDAAVLDSMGWVQYRLGNYPKALEFLRRAHQKNPDTEIAGHLSEVLWVSGQQEEAKRIWRAALAKEPDSPQLRQLRERFGW